MSSTLPRRIDAVDMLRGLAVAMMVLVNNPGSWSYVYAPLQHASWHGYTPTDLVFPFFLFIVGVSIVCAFQGVSGLSSARFKAIGLRTLKLIGLGLFLAVFFYNPFDPDYSWFEDRIEGVRWLGVLQRIGIVYFVTCLLVLTTGWRVWLAASIAISIFYIAMMTMISVPMPDGTLIAGNWEKGTNLAAYSDVLLLGANHVWAQTVPWAYDPEGLLSTFPAVVSCLLGGLMAKLMLSKGLDSVKWLIGLGICFVIVGHLMHQWVPINKALWTPSFVLATGGWATAGMGAFLWLTESAQVKKPFFALKVFGMNAIAGYMAAEIAARLLVMIPVGQQSLGSLIYVSLQPLFGNYLASLVYAVLMVLAVYGLVKYMYNRKIFLKV